MSPKDDVPQFYLLRPFNTIITTKEEEAKWLGRIAKDYSRPTRDVTATVISPYPPPQPREFTTIRATLGHSKSTAFHATLADLLHFDNHSKDHSKPSFDSDTIYYTQLDNVEAHLQKLLEDEDTKKLLQKWVKILGQPAWMITGFLSGENVLFDEDKSTDKAYTPGTSLPVSAIAAGFGVPLPIDKDIGVSRSSSTVNSLKLHATVPGRCIFAVEYTSVTRILFSTTAQYKLGNGPRGQNTFGDDDDTQETEGRSSTFVKGEQNMEEVFEDLDIEVESEDFGRFTLLAASGPATD